MSLKPSFVQWIETLTQPDVSQRFSTARQALEALQSGLTSISNRPALSSIQPASASQTDMRLPADTCVKISKSPDDELLIEIPGHYKALPAEFVNQQETSPFPLATLEEIKRSKNKTRSVFRRLNLSYAMPVVALALIPLLAVSPDVGLVVSVVILSGIFMLHLTISDKRLESSEFIYLNRRLDRFAIYKAPFPSLPSEDHGFQGAISRIEDVFQDTLHETLQERLKKYRVVTIQAGVREYSFGRGLSRTECVWLAREIRDWLELK